jgi:hypothetical protein
MKVRKECVQESLRILEFAARIKLRRDRDFKSLKEDEGQINLEEIKPRRKDTKLFGEESFRF